MDIQKWSQGIKWGFHGFQELDILGLGKIEELIKQSQPLVHNHVPTLICNGMVGPVLV
jgi:hypothetical protein